MLTAHMTRIFNLSAESHVPVFLTSRVRTDTVTDGSPRTAANLAVDPLARADSRIPTACFMCLHYIIGAASGVRSALGCYRRPPKQLQRCPRVGNSTMSSCSGQGQHPKRTHRRSASLPFPPDVPSFILFWLRASGSTSPIFLNRYRCLWRHAGVSWFNDIQMK